MRAVGKAERTDAAITPRLAQNPLQCVDAVALFVQIFLELALRVESTAAVLQHIGVAGGSESQSDLRLGQGFGLTQTAVCVIRAAPPVGSALKQHDPGSLARRQINVRSEMHTIAHKDAHSATRLDGGSRCVHCGTTIGIRADAPGPGGSAKPAQSPTRTRPAAPKAML